MLKPSVTVIVPVYNAESTLDACIRSLLGMEYPSEKLELIFVDNGSIDLTLTVLTKYASRIRILHEPKRGASAARNCGIRQAAHDLIAFTDADCVVDSKWLTYLVAPFAGSPDISVVGGKIGVLPDATIIERYGEVIHDHERAICSASPPYVITMNMAIRKSVLLKEGLFDETLLRSQDAAMSYKLHKNGYKFAYIPQALIFHKNERDLMGLFNEGFLHGFWGVKLFRKYRHSLFLHRRNLYFKTDINILKAFVNTVHAICFSKDKFMPSLCALFFNCGKKWGFVCDSFTRFFANDAEGSTCLK